MVEILNRKNKIEIKNSTLVFLFSIIVSSLFLFLVLSYESFNMNLYVDDKTYELIAVKYMNIASRIFQKDALIQSGATLSDDPLFYWIIAVLSFVFRNTLIIRIMNILLSGMCSVGIYKILTTFFSNSKALMGGILFAVMPYRFIPSVFIIKDILIMYLFILLIYYILSINKDTIHKSFNLLYIFVILILIYFLRDGLIEVLFILGVIMYTLYLLSKRKYSGFILLLLLLIIIFTVAGFTNSSNVIEKISYYLSYERTDTPISILRIDSILDFYKLPFSWLFAMFQPFSILKSINSWFDVFSLLNITLIPISIGNFLYFIFYKKRKPYLFYSYLLLFFGTIILSLGISRHYMFIFPMTFINYYIFISDSTKMNKLLHMLLSILLIFSLIIYYILKGA